MTSSLSEGESFTKRKGVKIMVRDCLRNIQNYKYFLPNPSHNLESSLSLPSSLSLSILVISRLFKRCCISSKFRDLRLLYFFGLIFLLLKLGSRLGMFRFLRFLFSVSGSLELEVRLFGWLE